MELPYQAISLGGSYQQRLSVGLGALPQSWDVRWHHLDAKDRTSLTSFFKTLQGHELFFAHLEGLVIANLVYCDFWQEISLGRNYWQITARLQAPY